MSTGMQIDSEEVSSESHGCNAMWFRHGVESKLDHLLLLSWLWQQLQFENDGSFSHHDRD